MKGKSFTSFWIIISIALLLVIIILVTWFISLEITKQEKFKEYNQQQLFIVTGTAGSIEEVFADVSTSLETLMNLEGIQNFNEEFTRLELQRKLEELSPLGIIDIGILDANGKAKFFAVDIDSEGVDYSWRTFFKEITRITTNTDSDMLSVTFQTLQRGELGLRIAVPLYVSNINSENPIQDGKIIGAIIGSMALDTLTDRFILPFKPPGSGQILLINNDLDIIWSSADDMLLSNILDASNESLSLIAEKMDDWKTSDARGGTYIFQSQRGSGRELIAYAPVQIGQELITLCMATPGSVARLASISSTRNQQFVFILSILTVLVGVIVGATVLRRETRLRFKAEEALKASEMEQAVLTERNRLANDLHDSVTQGLYGIVLYADAAKEQMISGNPLKAQGYLDEIKQAGKENLAEMRQLIFELRPQIVEEEGLVAALEARLYSVEKRAGLDVIFQSNIQTRLKPNIEDGLYRIAKEALNNALKHAQAETVRVFLNQIGRKVTMEITDDGSGFILQSHFEQGGMGLITMDERAKEMGGELEISSNPGEGTRIFVEVDG